MIAAIEPAVTPDVPPHTGIWPVEINRGVYGVTMVIVTEASLFICLFASYYFLGDNRGRWSIDIPPKLTLALIMLVLLLTSSLVVKFGERMVKQCRYKSARFSVLLTLVMGLVFLAIQAAEYKDHWKTLTPFSDSYGSIFYTITMFHAAHVVMGILMLGYLAILPNYGPSKFPPHRPFRVVALYWHFVDVVWIFVVVLLYLIPNYQAYVH